MIEFSEGYRLVGKQIQEKNKILQENVDEALRYINKIPDTAEIEVIKMELNSILKHKQGYPSNHLDLKEVEL